MNPKQHSARKRGQVGRQLVIFWLHLFTNVFPELTHVEPIAAQRPAHHLRRTNRPTRVSGRIQVSKYHRSCRRKRRRVYTLVGPLLVQQSNEACSVLFESPGSWNPDLYIQLSIFPKPQDVVCALTRPFHAGFVQVRPAHVDCCEPIRQSLRTLDLGSGCQKPS